MKNYSLLALCIAFSLALCAPALGQAAERRPLANFAGTLVDPGTELVAVGVKLSLVGPGEYFATTGAGGSFAFRNIPSGTYRYLFAYERGKAEPVRTILLAKDVKLSPVESEPVTLKRQALLERPEDTTPKLVPLEFVDGRKRESSTPVIMKEPLGLNWPEEYVSLRFAFAPYKCRRPSLRVMDGSTGREIPCQLTNVKYLRGDFVRSCTVTFLASLQPFQNKVYALCADWRDGFEQPKYETDLKLETHKKTGQQILSNSLIALRLPPESGQAMPADQCPAPILAVRGPDGVWFGKGSFLSKRTVQSFKCEQAEDGPLFKEFKITYTFAPEDDENSRGAQATDQYEVVLRLYARRDFVMIREQMTGNVDLRFRFSLHENLNPDVALLARNGAAAFRALPPPIRQEAETLAVFRAWNPPGLRRSHNWYGVLSSGNRRDAIGLVQVNGSSWAFPGRRAWADGSWLVKADDENEVRLMATHKPDLYLEFPHRQGTRQFALAVFDKNRNWSLTALAAKEPDSAHTHYLNRLHVLLSQLNITQLLAIKADHAKTHEQPKLLFNRQTFPNLKQMFEKNPNRFPVTLHDIFTGSRIHTSLVRAHVGSGVSMIAQSFAGSWDERNISGFCGRRAHPALIEPVIKHTVLLYDAHLKSGLFSEREKELVLATFALAAAQLEHPNWLLSFSHDPGAVARRDSALAVLSLFLSKHPQSSTRILSAKRRAVIQLRRAAATGGLPPETGGSMEALNLWAEIAPAFENAGGITQVGGSPFGWPEFLDALQRLPMLTAPPDKRYDGARLLPTIGPSKAGDTESLAITGVAAARFARFAPQLAAGLAWAWEQAGRPTFRPRARHRALLRAILPPRPEVPGKAPAKAESTRLPGFGALMRARFGQPEEAYALFKCSRLPYSLHHDQGSLLFHAFGAPLLVDPASPPGRPATWSHNTVRIGSRTHASPGSVVLFARQDEDDYAVGEIKIEALSRFKEYTGAELEAAAAAASKEKPFVLPSGHLPGGGLTADMLPAPQTLEHPVLVQRHVLFNKQRQYLVVLDRIRGYEETDVFFNVFADDARLEGTTAAFAGPFGVDVTLHAFGPADLRARLHKDGSQRWTLRLSQPPPAKPTEPKNEEKTGEKKVVPLAAVEYLTVVCPARRKLPGEGDVKEFAAPKVEKLQGITGVRIAYGKTVRYIFLSEKEVKYDSGEVRFQGTRGILTIRPTHFDVALFDAGEIRYQGRGVKTDSGMVRFKMAPGGFVEGEVSGPSGKRLTFYKLGRSPRSLLFRTDGQQFIGDGDSGAARYGVHPGSHTVSIQPK